MAYYSSLYEKCMPVFFEFPLPSAFEESNINTKSTKVSGHVLLRESADKWISDCASQLKCDFWDVVEAVVGAESRLEF